MIDLHTHSCFSDGTEPPEALVQAAEAMGLYALALTDHDTLAGLPAFLALQPQCPTLLIPGIELSCVFLNQELHVLGLFIEPEDGDLQARVADLGERRRARNATMLAKLRGLGIALEWEDVTAHATSDLVSRAHFAKALTRKGAVRHPVEAFQSLIGAGGPAYVPFRDLTPREAARWIREAGGVPVVAHPGRTIHRNLPWEDAMRELKRQGMAGFEAYYSEYGPAEERYFCGLADRLHMAKSGGSDYHGGTKPTIRLGTGRGNLHVPDHLVEDLEIHRGLGPDRWGDPSL